MKKAEVKDSRNTGIGVASEKKNDQKGDAIKVMLPFLQCLPLSLSQYLSI